MSSTANDEFDKKFYTKLDLYEKEEIRGVPSRKDETPRSSLDKGGDECTNNVDKEAGYDIHGNAFTKTVERMERYMGIFYNVHKDQFWLFVKMFLLVIYLGFLFYVMFLNFKRALPLVVMTTSLASYLFLGWTLTNWGSCIQEKLIHPTKNFVNRHQTAFSVFVKFFMVVSVVSVMASSGVFTLIIYEPIRLVSIVGLLSLLVISFLGSKQPSRINWQTVAWGLYLQVMFAIFILRTDVGFHSFKWIGAEIEAFLNYALVGANFVFGPEPLTSHFFLFAVLPVVIFSSAVFALLFYCGVMQKMIQMLAWPMQHTMAVSGVEAFSAAANVFLGMNLVPLCIKPYLTDMTVSELHSLMVGGFATIAGGVLAAYVNMGISAAHLLSASIISAPAALVTAKMFYPETECPKTAKDAVVKVDSVIKETNAFEAFCNGAIDGTKVCAFIIGNLVAFVSLLAFLDSSISWLGHMADIEDMSFTLLCSYLLYPFAILLGVNGSEDCLKVAGLIGTKTFLNEFVAYSELSDYIKEGAMQPRSVVISTYALCGFSNVGAIGIMIGSLASLAPERLHDVSRIGVRSLIAGIVACQMTACLAGVLYDETRQHFITEQNVTGMVEGAPTDGSLVTIPTTFDLSLTDILSSSFG
ncbi:Solute carrier family 28 member 3 [Holothuria leucospilota]|uniref:Solute carrier family 28 member 3 n=1 Tax=Holothuria leucospilota TaxID=206669 RepID=A0A9Q1BGU0_HOLLE|nr:Solute carrier family 28 member 3 [Holothuria leucospilota]